MCGVDVDILSTFYRVAEGGFSIPTPPTSCTDWLTAGPLWPALTPHPPSLSSVLHIFLTQFLSVETPSLPIQEITSSILKYSVYFSPVPQTLPPFPQSLVPNFPPSPLGVRQRTSTRLWFPGFLYFESSICTLYRHLVTSTASCHGWLQTGEWPKLQMQV